MTNQPLFGVNRMVAKTDKHGAFRLRLTCISRRPPDTAHHWIIAWAETPVIDSAQPRVAFVRVGQVPLATSVEIQLPVR